MQILASQIATHRPLLLRFARQKLRNDAWAEDAVSETLVAALDRPSAYAGRAKLGTWLVGILRHKVVDQIRRNAGEHSTEALPDEPGHGEGTATVREGACEAYADWGDPQEVLSRREFMAEFDTCLKALPAQHARAIVLRDLMEEDTGDICKQLDVTPNNLCVMLHRARRQLRISLRAYGSGVFSNARLHARA